MRPLAALLLLAACAAPQVDADLARIVVASGGSRITVTPVDLVVEEPTIPGMGRPATARTIPGAFSRAAAVIAAEGPAARAAARPGTSVCPDYGTDLVLISPPISGFDQLSAACPDPAVLALTDAVRAALEP